ncbi:MULTISPECIES: vitamin K epoxide reductase family protein [Micrococcaceae]|uniref:vitamin K epoxide reductase family protein n=1 Tax=unclassified Kocuria TaxID=2649579 RepID=UPI001EDE5C13|nr:MULTISPECIES: vitamin K epoxide reductase family protein [unclassified Kocuria]
MSTSSVDPAPRRRANPSISSTTDAREKPFAWLLVTTGAIGFIASAALVFERLQVFLDAGHKSSCDINALLNCGTVMRTPQAELFGFPNPFIGIVAYAVILTIGVGLFAGARFARWYWICVEVGVLLGSLFTFWLWYETTFQIDALCLYCMIVWIVQTALAVNVTMRNIRTGVIPVSPRLAESLPGWSWFLVIMILLVLFGIIFIRFFSNILSMI